MRVRTASVADADAVSALLARCYPALMASAYGADVLAVALPAMTKAQPKLLGSGRFAVAELTGLVVACGGFSLDRPGSGEVLPGLAHIRHFATDPTEVRGGLGRAIYDWCREGARREGCSAFECYAALNAVSFYRAMGFEVVRETAIPLGASAAFPVAVMRAEIAVTS